MANRNTRAPAAERTGVPATDALRWKSQRHNLVQYDTLSVVKEALGTNFNRSRFPSAAIKDDLCSLTVESTRSALRRRSWLLAASQIDRGAQRQPRGCSNELQSVGCWWGSVLIRSAIMAGDKLLVDAHF
jgi:hypothetical protein